MQGLGFGTCGFPKIMGTTVVRSSFSGPLIIFGSILRSPCFGKLPDVTNTIIRHH